MLMLDCTTVRLFCSFCFGALYNIGEPQVFLLGVGRAEVLLACSQLCGVAERLIVVVHVYYAVAIRPARGFKTPDDAILVDLWDLPTRPHLFDNVTALLPHCTTEVND